MDLGALLQGATQGVPQGVSMGLQINEAVQRKQTMDIAKLERAWSLTKDPNIPKDFKVKLWNSSVLPTLKSLYPKAGDMPELDEWHDGLSELSKQGAGITKRTLKKEITPDDGLAALAELETNYTGAIEDSKARLQPFRKIIEDNEKVTDRLTRAGITSNPITRERYALLKQYRLGGKLSPREMEIIGPLISSPWSKMAANLTAQDPLLMVASAEEQAAAYSERVIQLQQAFEETRTPGEGPGLHTPLGGGENPSGGAGIPTFSTNAEAEAAFKSGKFKGGPVKIGNETGTWE